MIYYPHTRDHTQLCSHNSISTLLGRFRLPSVYFTMSHERRGRGTDCTHFTAQSGALALIQHPSNTYMPTDVQRDY